MLRISGTMTAMVADPLGQNPSFSQSSTPLVLSCNTMSFVHCTEVSSRGKVVPWCETMVIQRNHSALIPGLARESTQKLY